MQKDTLTEAGAMLLASQIVGYWTAQGRKVKAWAVPVVDEAGNRLLGLWGVRSDMLNGVPLG